MVSLKDDRNIPIFIHAELDDYGLDPYQYRIYARIARRAGKETCFESIPSMAAGCKMSTGKVKSSLKFLVDHRFITRHSRPGETSEYCLTNPNLWIPSHRTTQPPHDPGRVRSGTRVVSDPAPGSCGGHKVDPISRSHKCFLESTQKSRIGSQPDLDEEIPNGYSPPQKYVHPVERIEEQFRSQRGRNYAWRQGRNLIPGFAEYVGNSLPKTGDDSMPPAVKGSRYIRNRENEHDFEAIEAYLEAFQSGQAEKNIEKLQREVVRVLQAAGMPVRIPEGIPGAIAGGIIRNLSASQCESVLSRYGQGVAS